MYKLINSDVLKSSVYLTDVASVRVGPITLASWHACNITTYYMQKTQNKQNKGELLKAKTICMGMGLGLPSDENSLSH
jgi:hypothetical protein